MSRCLMVHPRARNSAERFVQFKWEIADYYLDVASSFGRYDDIATTQRQYAGIPRTRHVRISLRGLEFSSLLRSARSSGRAAGRGGADAVRDSKNISRSRISINGRFMFAFQQFPRKRYVAQRDNNSGDATRPGREIRFKWRYSNRVSS